MPGPILPWNWAFRLSPMSTAPLPEFVSTKAPQTRERTSGICGLARLARNSFRFRADLTGERQRGCDSSLSRVAGWEFGFGILENPARYPSGPRERSAKPPFVGSNPTRASSTPKHLAESWLTRRCLHCNGNCSGCVVENPHGRPSVYIRGLQPQTGVLGTSYDTKYVTRFSENHLAAPT